MKRIIATDCEQHLLRGARFIDVRAPIEFAAGSIPGAVNLPLLSDDERHQVGVVYKEQGQAAAVALGHTLVQGSVKDARVQAWLTELKAHPEAILFCFRGGLRSQISQTWLAEAGASVPIVEGGYKALRTYLMETIERLSSRLQFQIVSGPTGSGKTAYIKASGQAFIDLEDLAKHRGSAFGALEEPQPNQVNFENAVALELLKLAHLRTPILAEDESAMIGHRLIPVTLFERLRQSERLILNVPIESRVEAIFLDYVLNSKLGLRNDVSQFDSFRSSVRAISRKLGGERTQEILADMDFAQAQFESGQGLDSNRVWIRKLLEWYYDPNYSFARERREKNSGATSKPSDH